MIRAALALWVLLGAVACGARHLVSDEEIFSLRDDDWEVRSEPREPSREMTPEAREDER